MTKTVCALSEIETPARIKNIAQLAGQESSSTMKSRGFYRFTYDTIA